MPPVLPSRLVALLTSSQPPPLRLLLQLHAHVLITGLLSAPSPTPFAPRLVAAFAFSDPASHSSPRPLLHALALLASLPSPPDSAAPYNAVLRSLSLCPDRGRLLDRCLPLYRSLLRSGSARPDHLTFPFLLKACSRIKDPACGAAVLGHVRRLGFGADVFVLNAAMHFLAASGPVVHARRLFDESSVQDVVSWNTLIGGYVRKGLPREALEVFWRMVEDGSVKPDEVTMIGAVSGCAQLQDLELGKRLHGYVESNGVRCTVRLMNTVMDMYVKCGSLELVKSVFERIDKKTIVSWTTMLVGHARLGMMEDARKLFHEMPERDVFPWNALMAGYVQSKQSKEAIALFHEMQEAKVDPNEITMLNLLSACSQLGALETGMWVHHYIDRQKLSLSVALGTSLVDMYAKCGNINKAICVFKEIPEKNALTWTAMICGLANHGHANEAIEYFQRMIELGLQPDEITFIGVLSACCHAGLVEDGRKFFSLMSSKYHLQRKMKHYSCMIDLLGRAGHLDEAEQLVNSMPMDPDAVVWGALFFACRMHGNITLGEKAAMKLVELDPSDSGIYVLLATMYAEANMRKKADKVRVMMRHLGVEKVPGCSCIELNGVVHEFLVKDKSHADTGAIYDCLHEITLQMRCIAKTFDISASAVV